MSQLIGAAFGTDSDPINHAQDLGAQCFQIQVGDPQGWKKPAIDFPGGNKEFAQLIKSLKIPVYVHTAYVINVASTNNRIRIPSRKLLQQTVDLAAELNASGVIVHGGHVTKEDDPKNGFDNWRKACEQTEMHVPVLIENTAGGSHAMARTLANLKNLWQSVGHTDVGFCLDTCHAWAAGIELKTAVKDIKNITKRIDLIHANGSRDEFDSSRDRHSNFSESILPQEQIAQVVRDADCNVIIETAEPGVKIDIEFLKKVVK
jgi:deoxyribonuclease-4